ncbi:MAG: GNAT family protein [Alphaproteobacteria bacterium]
MLQAERRSDWKAWAKLRAESREFLAPFESTWPRDALTRRAFHRRVRRHAADRREGSAYHFLIFHADDGTLLGGINLTNVRRGTVQSGSLGYWIGAPFARRGFMTEALRGLLSFAFLGLGLHRIDAACLPENAASQRLLEGAGFTGEGRAREYIRIDGAWRDHLTYGILRSDWDRKRSAPA